MITTATDGARKNPISNDRDSAARLLVPDVPRASAHEAAGAVRQRLAGCRFSSLDLVLVTDRDGTYIGALDLRALMAADAESLVGPIAKADWPTARPETDQEHAVEMARAAGVGALPVVTEDGRPLGCIPSTRLIEIQSREHHEDVHRIVGMLRNHGAEHALESSPLSRLGVRLPWLLIGLVLSTAGTALLASFEHALRTNVAIAFYIPAIVYLTDAIGTQTEAIAVRGFSLRDWPIRRILTLETVTGGLIGLSLGSIAFLGILVLLGDHRIAAGVGITLLIAGTLASALGLLLPWALSRLDIDPAFGSGPLATIIQDVSTLAVYLLVMTTLLPT